MTQHIEVDQPAGSGERFADGDFDTQIGKIVPMYVEGRPVGNCKVVGAKVAEDGTSVRLTLEIPDDVLPHVPMRPNGLTLDWHDKAE